MTETIRKARQGQGLTVHALADRLGVSPSAVSQMERSEADGTIKLATLQRAHDALGSRLIVSAVVPGAEAFPRREERVSWELHRAIAVKLLEDPGPILAAVPENVERVRANVHGELANQWLDDWARMASSSIAETIYTLLDPSQYGIDMRQVAPFHGVLTQDERLTAIVRAAPPGRDAMAPLPIQAAGPEV